MVAEPPAPDPGLVSYDDALRGRPGELARRETRDPDYLIARGGAIGFLVVATAFLLGLALVLVLWFGKQLGVW